MSNVRTTVPLSPNSWRIWLGWYAGWPRIIRWIYPMQWVPVPQWALRPTSSYLKSEVISFSSILAAETTWLNASLHYLCANFFCYSSVLEHCLGRFHFFQRKLPLGVGWLGKPSYLFIQISCFISAPSKHPGKNEWKQFRLPLRRQKALADQLLIVQTEDNSCKIFCESGVFFAKILQDPKICCKVLQKFVNDNAFSCKILQKFLQ